MHTKIVSAGRMVDGPGGELDCLAPRTGSPGGG
jgi:hypothetical protein